MNLKDKTILITGGTGSFGSSFLKSLIKTNVKKIRILSRDELKQFNLRLNFSDPRIEFFIGDTRDKNSLNLAFKNTDLIFHAAALKQVPSCEFHPAEAIKTNILGSKNVIEASLENNVSKTIFLSTDKAVNPINVMGMTKSLMERLVISYARKTTSKDTKLIITRYGNVMFSRGSVIPLWINQIKNKKKITITDPLMTRFLMSLDECHKLVYHAFKNGESGDIFVQNSSSSTLVNLSSAIHQIFGMKERQQIIGHREGEKRHEVLISEYEMPNAVKYKNFFKISNKSLDLNFNDYFFQGDVDKQIKMSEFNSSQNPIDVNDVISKIMKTKEINDYI